MGKEMVGRGDKSSYTLYLACMVSSVCKERGRKECADGVAKTRKESRRESRRIDVGRIAMTEDAMVMVEGHEKVRLQGYEPRAGDGKRE